MSSTKQRVWDKHTRAHGTNDLHCPVLAPRGSHLCIVTYSLSCSAPLEHNVDDFGLWGCYHLGRHPLTTSTLHHYTDSAPPYLNSYSVRSLLSADNSYNKIMETKSLMPVHRSRYLAPEIIQLIVEQSIEPYSVRIEPNDIPTRESDLFARVQLSAGDKARTENRCTPSPNAPRHLALVSESFGEGLKQGLKQKFNGHVDISLAPGDWQAKERIQMLIAKHNLNWLVTATTTLRIHEYFARAVDLVAIFPNLQVLEIDPRLEPLEWPFITFEVPTTAQQIIDGVLDDEIDFEVDRADRAILTSNLTIIGRCPAARKKTSNI